MSRSPNTHRSFLDLSNFPKYRSTIQHLGLFRWLQHAHFIGEFPQVTGQRVEHAGRYHRPVIGDPAPDDRGDRCQYRCDVGPAQCMELLGKPVPEPLDGLGARFDKQLTVRVAAKIEPEEIEPLRKGNDPGFGVVERQPSWLQLPGQLRLDLLGLLPGVAARDQVIGISGKHRAARPYRPGVIPGVVPDACGLLPARAMRYSTAKAK